MAPNCEVTGADSSNDAQYDSQPEADSDRIPKHRASVGLDSNAATLPAKFDEGDEAWLDMPGEEDLEVIITKCQNPPPSYKWFYTLSDAHTGAEVTLPDGGLGPHLFPETRLSSRG